MPSCRPDVIPAVLYKVMEFKPKTVLDVGSGFGKWGCLITEYLKYWCEIVPSIDAVEAHQPYIDYSPSYGKPDPASGFYDIVYNINVKDLPLHLLADYDLVLLIDVIEHLDKEVGKSFLDSIKNHYIVSTPGYWNPQQAVFGNEFERHISKWGVDDFENTEIVIARDNRRHIIAWK